GPGPKNDQAVIFDLQNRKPLVGVQATVQVLALSADANTLAGAAYLADGLQISVWTCAGPRPRRRRSSRGGGIEKDEVPVYGLAAGQLKHSFAPSKKTGPGRRFLLVRTTPDSSLLLTHGTDETVRLWTTPFGTKP